MTAADRDPLVLSEEERVTVCVCGMVVGGRAGVRKVHTTRCEQQRAAVEQIIADRLAARAPQPAPTSGVGDEGMRARVEALAAKWDDECANGNGVRSGCLPRNGRPNHSHDCGMTRENAAADLRAALDPPDTDQGTP